jgi:hypothetical protein
MSKYILKGIKGLGGLIHQEREKVPDVICFENNNWTTCIHKVISNVPGLLKGLEF